MKLITIVRNLQNAGIDIKYRVRKDGGILITQVQGVKFSGAQGNAYIRNMTGESLSEAQIKQRQKIKPPKRVRPSARKKPDIPEDVRKQIQKLQRQYRKDNTKGKPTISNYRHVKEKYGEEEARRLLKQSEYYIKGIAYEENIEALIQRLQQIANTLTASGDDSSPILECIDATIYERDNNRMNFTETKLKHLLDAIYTFESEYNAYSQGTSNEYSDAKQIIEEFKSNYLIIVRSKYNK